MRKVKVSVNYYHKTALDKIGTFAGGVRIGIYSHPDTFSSPPFTEEEVKDIIKIYSETRAAYSGRRMSKANFKLDYNALITMLDSLATYVDETSKGDPVKISLSGFRPTRPSNSSWLPPLQPQVKVSRNVDTGELFAESNKLENAIYYGCIVFKNSAPERIAIQPGGIIEFSNNENFVFIDVTKGREKEYRNLSVGVMYYFYFYAANANGVSALSEVKSIKCIKG